MQTTLTLRLQLVPTEPQEPLAHLEVELWEYQTTTDMPMGVATANAKGQVAFPFTGSEAKALLEGMERSLYFKVFDGEKLLVDTSQGEHLLFWTVDAGEEALRLYLPPATGIYRVHGRVFEGEGIGRDGLRVVLLDVGKGTETLLGETTSASGGSYDICYRTGYLKTKEQQPELQVRVYDPAAGGALVGTSDLQQGVGMEAVVNVVVSSEQPAEKYIVVGQVRQPDGEPLAGIAVVAYQKKLGNKEVLLDRDITNPKGEYAIEYRPEAKPFNLVVKAIDGNGKELATYPVICNAKPKESADLTVGGAFRGASEYRKLKEMLLPILRKEGIGASDLSAQDIELLACNYPELNAEHAAFFVVSERLWKETQINQEALYGLLRQKMPVALVSLVSQSSDILQQALETAIGENIIGKHIEELIPQILKELKAQIIRLSLREPEPEKANFGTLLESAGIRDGRKEKVLQSFLEHKGTTEEYWKNLRRSPDFNDEEIDDLQHSLKVATVALNHEPLISELLRMRRRGGEFREFKDLVRLDRETWKTLLKKDVNGKPIGAPDFLGKEADERIERFAAYLPRVMEVIFPTATLVHQLKQAPATGLEEAVRFLEINPEFEFQTTRLNDYLKERPNALNGFADAEMARKNLEGLERGFYLTPAFDRAKTIVELTKVFDASSLSAFAIRRMGAGYPE